MRALRYRIEQHIQPVYERESITKKTTQLHVFRATRDYHFVDVLLTVFCGLFAFNGELQILFIIQTTQGYQLWVSRHFTE